MTKLRVMSDLHLEFGPLDLEPIGEDVLVLAGDVGIYTDGALWARDYARRHQLPVVMIAGNHEFYRNNKHRYHTVATTYADLRSVAANEPLFTFLQDDVTSVAGVTFLGATLWTGYSLNGDPVIAKLRAGQSMNDHRLIWLTERDRFTPEHAAAQHTWSAAWLRESLPRNYDDGPVVVLTHHLPSSKSIAGRYADSQYNAAYASNLDDLVATSGVKLWLHGHTHVSQDYLIGETRVVCNPRGYDGYELNPDFNPNLLIEV